MKATIYADFNNADAHGRLRLNCIGTIEDLARQSVQLREGLPLTVHDEDLETEGAAHFSAEESVWVAIIDWRMIRHRSETAATKK